MKLLSWLTACGVVVGRLWNCITRQFVRETEIVSGPCPPQPSPPPFVSSPYPPPTLVRIDYINYGERRLQRVQSSGNPCNHATHILDHYLQLAIN